MRGLPVQRGSSMPLCSAVALSQHPDEHRPQRSVLLAVDQKLGEGVALRVGDRNLRISLR